ncbi:O-antigen ligase family protein [Kineococcus sp. SYSU DK004]|uniref:O-antigen ligase family protein n=1 Tax=Kineococcus sp. SYSU DK004 TaxID=3383125 RepID=UPI003D7EF4FA
MRWALAPAAVALSAPVAFLPLGPVQVVEAVTLVVVATVLAGRALDPWDDVPATALWVVPLLLAAVVSAPWSVHEDATFRALAQLSAGALLALATCRAVGGPRGGRVVVRAVVAAAVVVGAQALPSASQQRAAFGGAVVAGRSTGNFAQPNEFGLFTAVALVLAVALASAATSRTERFLTLTAVAVLAASLAVSLSRGAWIGAAAGVAALALLLPRVRRGLLVGLPVAGALVAAAGAALPDLVGTTLLGRVSSLSAPADNPYDERPAIYAEARRLVEERPVTGYGPGTFPYASEGATAIGTAGQAEHAHNALLTVAAEAGLPGALALVVWTLAVAAAVLSGLHREKTAPTGAEPLLTGALLAGCGAALFVVVVHGFVDYPLRNPLNFLLLWLLAGVVLGLRAHQGDPARPDQESTRDTSSALHRRPALRHGRWS